LFALKTEEFCSLGLYKYCATFDKQTNMVVDFFECFSSSLRLNFDKWAYYFSSLAYSFGYYLIVIAEFAEENSGNFDTDYYC
jgi:hypothetical protein